MSSKSKVRSPKFSTASVLPATHCCEAMATHLASGDVPVVYSPRFREYALKIIDGGSAKQLIDFCPCCGSRLPESLRDEWFEQLGRDHQQTA